MDRIEPDWELVARLALQETLMQILLASMHAHQTDGRAQLAALREATLDCMLNRYSLPVVLDDQRREEWQLHATTITQRTFHEIERRRAAAALPGR